MEHARYLRAQAKRCYAIARMCRDLEAANLINTVANSLRDKAVEQIKTARRRRPVSARASAVAR